MADQYLRVKVYENGEYYALNADGRKCEMEEMEIYLDNLFNPNRFLSTKPYWFEVETCDDDNDFLIYCVEDNPNPKNGSEIESRIRRAFPREELDKWSGIQHRVDTKTMQYNPFDGVINVVFELENGPVSEAEKTEAERKAKEDALKMMEEALKKAEAHAARLRKNIEMMKAELAATA